MKIIIKKYIPKNSRRYKVCLFIMKKIRIVLNLLFKLPFIKKYKPILVAKMNKNATLSKLLEVTKPSSIVVNDYIRDGNSIPLHLESFVNRENKRICVHLHLYYFDLLKEFCAYLKNIEYNFDLFITVNKDFNERQIKQINIKFKKNKYIDNVCIKKTENIGKDIVPMFVLFGKEISEYDFLLHIHSKKSLRDGKEDCAWRKYLLDNLIGSKEIVSKYIYLLNKYNVEIAYPEAYYEYKFPAVFSRLSEFNNAKKFYKKIGIDLHDSEYIFFPIGNMFWCKTSIFKELYNNIKSFDTALEFESSNDTEKGLEYILERISYDLVFFHKSSYAILNFRDRNFYENENRINFFQNSYLSINDLKALISTKEIVSFDVFDTLVTRCVLQPDDVFDLIDEKVRNKYDFDKGEYIKIRKRSESLLRSKLKDHLDLDLNAIYVQFAKEKNISLKLALEIKNIEINTDISLIIPRNDMLVLYNWIKQKNIKIHIVTDMYYSEAIIKQILKKCGYCGWNKIFVSSKCGLRKDRGDFWDYYFKIIDKNKHIHIGDNKESDGHQLWMKKANAVLIPKGSDLFNGLFNSKLLNDDTKIVCGLLSNKYLFNSPFSTTKQYVVSNEMEYGYSLIGPILLGYIIWLVNLKYDNYYFCSREGYFLKKIFDYVCKISKINVNSYYFYTSRRATLVSNISDINDIKNVCFEYSGNAYDFFINRLGVTIPNKYKTLKIHLPFDKNIVFKIAKKYSTLILANSKEERINYLKYISKNNFSFNNKSVLVDIGYSGTSHYELAKMTKKRIHGAYLATSIQFKPAKLNCVNNSYLNDCIKPFNGALADEILLESFLIAPHGQLQHFDKLGNPVFASSPDTATINTCNKIYCGILDLIKDVKKLFDKRILDFELQNNFVYGIYKQAAEFSRQGKINNVISKIVFEDYFCVNKTINVAAFQTAGINDCISLSTQKNKIDNPKDVIFDNLNNCHHKNICIFATYNNEGIITDSVVYYIKKLSVYFDVIVVGDCKLYDGQIDKIREYIVYAKYKRHLKYDFGSYSIGYKIALKNNLIKSNTEVLLTNDSCIGPLFPLDNIFNKMAKENCDFWGLTSSNDFDEHVQSFFIYFKNKIIKSKYLYYFLRKIHKQSDFWGVVIKYEVGLSRYLIKKGFRFSSFTPIKDEFVCSNYPIKKTFNKMIYPLYLIKKYDFPFIKKKIFINLYENFCDEDMSILLNTVFEINEDVYKIIIHEYSNTINNIISIKKDKYS